MTVYPGPLAANSVFVVEVGILVLEVVTGNVKELVLVVIVVVTAVAIEIVVIAFQQPTISV